MRRFGVKMKKIFLTLLFGILLLSTASAISDLGTFKQGSNVVLVQTCASCTYNNITTVTYPNSTVITINDWMAKDGSFYSRSFNLTDALGTYLVNGVGDLDGVDTIWGYNFEVTQTGFDLEISESILYIIILIATFILFLAFLYPAITLPYSNETNPDGSITRIARAKYLKLLSIWFAYGFLMWSLQTLNGISSSFIKLTYLSNFITSIFTYTQWFSVGITFLILTIAFIEVWKDIILNETIKKHGKAFLDGRIQ